MTPDTVIIVTSIIIGIAVIFGIYKLATSSLSERSVLKTSKNSHQAIKAILTALITILLFLAFFVTFRIFTSQ